jgi:glycosyltransferase involved in cell wall biosynthesis
VLGLEDRVTIAAIPGSERQKMADLVASAGLFVLFSEYEAHPVAVMEAISLRRPVLVSDAFGLRELASEGICRALSCDSGPEQLAAAMAEAMSARQTTLDVVLQDWDGCAHALSQVYGEVMGYQSARRLSHGGRASWPPAKRA